MYLKNVKLKWCSVTGHEKAPKVSELKKQNNQREKKSVLPYILVCSGNCIDRLQPFQCLIFVAVCRSIASFSTSVLQFSQSLHVVNVIPVL